MENSDALIQLLGKAGENSHDPEPPLGGIPKQRVPGWIRWPLRCVLLPFVLIDLSMQRVARILIRPPYKREGECLRRGNCCRYILLPQSRGLLDIVFKWWSTEILGFYLRSPKTYLSDDKPVWLMGCRYLKKDGSCAHYHLRPVVCRKWPLVEYFGHPRILKGCGFRAVEKIHR